MVKHKKEIEKIKILIDLLKKKNDIIYYDLIKEYCRVHNIGNKTLHNYLQCLYKNSYLIKTTYGVINDIPLKNKIIYMKNDKFNELSNAIDIIHNLMKNGS